MTSIQEKEKIDFGFAPDLEISSSSNTLCRLLDRALIHLREYKRYKEISDEYSQALQLYLFISSAKSFIDLGGGDQCFSQRKNIIEEAKQALPQNTTIQTLKNAIDYYTGIANALRTKVVQERQRISGSSGGTVLPKSVCDAVKIDYVKGSEACQYWFDTIIGLEEAKNELKNGFLNPLLYPSLYPGVSKGILLYGPPGTGKTLLAKAAVNELTARGEGCVKVLFFAPQGSDLKGKFVGESEAKIEAIFKCAREAATNLEESENSKGNKIQVISIIFIDEVESVAASRSNDSTGINATTVNALLQQIDGIKSGKKVFVWANTNYPWLLDSAFLRRFDSSILIDLPSERDIFEQLNLALSEFITGKTLKVIAPNSENEKEKNPFKNSDACSLEEAQNEIFSWKQQKYSSYVKVETSSLSAVAKFAFINQFSGSDVRRFFNDVIRKAADQAILNNWFFALPIDSKGTIKESVDNPIYISTLSLTAEEIDKQDKKRFKRLKEIERGVVESIELTLSQNVGFGNEKKTFIARDKIPDPRLVYNDPLISNLYVEKDYSTMENPWFLYEFRVQTIQLNQSPTPNNQKSNLLFSDIESKTEEELYFQFKDKPNFTEIRNFNIPFKRDEQKLYFLVQFKESWFQFFSKLSQAAASVITSSLTGAKDFIVTNISQDKAVAKQLEELSLLIGDREAKLEPKNQNPLSPVKQEINETINVKTVTEEIFSQSGYIIFGNFDQWKSTTKPITLNYEFFKGLFTLEDIPVNTPIYSNTNFIFNPLQMQSQNRIMELIRINLYTQAAQTISISLERKPFSKQNKQQLISKPFCDGSLLEKNSRFFNWSINQPTWNSSMLKIKSTIDKTLYKTLKQYKDDPDTVLRQQQTK